jgi:hypothetical protein
LLRTGFGPDAASIQAIVDQNRADLGTLNRNVVGWLGTGRRAINWDALPNLFAALHGLPSNFLNNNSPRGPVFRTPGTAVQVSDDSSNPANTPARFANTNPTYAKIVRDFNPEWVFSPIGSNIVDLTFFVFGTGIPALPRGLGAI